MAYTNGHVYTWKRGRGQHVHAGQVVAITPVVTRWVLAPLLAPFGWTRLAVGVSRWEWSNPHVCVACGCGDPGVVDAIPCGGRSSSRRNPLRERISSRLNPVQGGEKEECVLLQNLRNHGFLMRRKLLL